MQQLSDFGCFGKKIRHAMYAIYFQLSIRKLQGKKIKNKERTKKSVWYLLIYFARWIDVSEIDPMFYNTIDFLPNTIILLQFTFFQKLHNIIHPPPPLLILFTFLSQMKIQGKRNLTYSKIVIKVHEIFRNKWLEKSQKRD